MAHTLDAITYSSVITRETMHIALTVAVQHNLKVNAVESFWPNIC